MKQKKISNLLKVLVVLLGIMGLVFFGGLTVVKIYHPEIFDGLFNTQQDGSFIVFSWITAVFCYLVLFQFWKVCTEIGNDNSFSLENALSFHKMAIFGAICGATYVIRIIYQAVFGTGSLFSVIYNVFLIFIAAAFFIICECLAQLIKNAYEVKLENEYTI